MKPIPDWLAPYKNEWRTVGGMCKILRASNTAFQPWLREVMPRLRCVVIPRSEKCLGDTRKYLVKHVWAMAQAHSVVLEPTNASDVPGYIERLEATVIKLEAELGRARDFHETYARETTEAKNIALGLDFRGVKDQEGHLKVVPSRGGMLPAELAIKLILSRAPSMNPGVYFLLDKREVVYIGQSTSVLSRMVGHNDKVFDDVRMIEVAEAPTRLELERALISEFKPKYNILGTGRTPPKTAQAIAARLSEMATE